MQPSEVVKCPLKILFLILFKNFQQICFSSVSFNSQILRIPTYSVILKSLLESFPSTFDDLIFSCNWQNWCTLFAVFQTEGKRCIKKNWSRITSSKLSKNLWMSFQNADWKLTRVHTFATKVVSPVKMVKGYIFCQILN